MFLVTNHSVPKRAAPAELAPRTRAKSGEATRSGPAWVHLQSTLCCASAHSEAGAGTGRYGEEPFQLLDMTYSVISESFNGLRWACPRWAVLSRLRVCGV